MTEPATVTLRELWVGTASLLGARHEARWICEVAVGAAGAEFDRALDDPLTERVVAHHDAMVARVRAGEPLQYVLGSWQFRHLDLLVDRRVLIPRPETESVAGAAIELARQVSPRVVADLGTGSGAIGLSLAAELPLDGTTVWITDVSPDALDVARSNLAGIGRAARNVRVGVGSWFEALPGEVRCDVIVSNPPYVAVDSPLLAADVAAWEPHLALFAGPDGLDAIRLIAASAPEFLTADGCLVLEIGADQGDPVASLLAGLAYRHIDIRPDAAGHPRIAIAQRPR